MLLQKNQIKLSFLVLTILTIIGEFCFIHTVLAESVRFAIVSDTQGDPVNTFTFPIIVNEVLKMSPEVQFVIVAGDLVWGVDEYKTAMPAQYAQWLDITAPWFESDMTGAKVYPIPGNHDARDPAKLAELWVTLFPDLPDNGPDADKQMTYSFDAGPCHIVMLNNYSAGIEHQVSDMDWLTSDLAGSSQPIKLVFGHDPAYPFYRHIGSSLDAYPEERDAFWQVLVDQNVRAYFCGHEHQYDHWLKDGVHQITSGGLEGQFDFSQNFFIVDADENDVTVSVCWYSGLMLKSFKLSDTEDVSTDEHRGESELKEAVPCTFPGIFMIVGLFTLMLNFQKFISAGSLPRQKSSAPPWMKEPVL
jgi:hypothetical protein